MMVRMPISQWSATEHAQQFSLAVDAGHDGRCDRRWRGDSAPRRTAGCGPKRRSFGPAAQTAPARPINSPPAARQAQPAAGPQAPSGAPTPTRPQMAAQPAVQPAAAVTKTASPPPASTLQVMAVVNGEQITRTELGASASAAMARKFWRAWSIAN